MLRFSGAGVSDVGRRRSHNEDAAYLAPYVAVVADGVGGAAAGEVASATAAYVVAATALARFGAPPGIVVREAVAGALASLQAGVAQDESRQGMATTLTCVATDGSTVALAHVGDSRAYLWRDQSLARITRDHTYVQQLVEDGTISAEDALAHPWRHVVMRSLHSSAEVPPESVAADVVLLDLAPGDRLLLCSDGVSDLCRSVGWPRSCGWGCPAPLRRSSCSTRSRQGDVTTPRPWCSTSRTDLGWSAPARRWAR